MKIGAIKTQLERMQAAAARRGQFPSGSELLAQWQQVNPSVEIETIYRRWLIEAIGG